MSNWKQTPTLDAFAAMYDADEHLWWRIECGHHQNLYEAAVERYERAEAAIQRVRELHTPYWDVTEMCRECSDDWPCDTLRALDGDSDD